MKLVSLQFGRLESVPVTRLGREATKIIITGLPAFDRLLPRHGLRGGTLHEILAGEGHGASFFMALLLARAAMHTGMVAWCDPKRTLYPPAVTGMGLPLDRLLLLRCKPAEVVWATAQCLACKSISAAVAPLGRVSRAEARRLQLAAEAGGGIGLLLRPARALEESLVATSRWLVRPAAGTRTSQRWAVELLHGHGGLIGYPVILEASRETAHVRAFETMAYRPGQTPTASIPA